MLPFFRIRWRFALKSKIRI
nr:unnamed protein product [Callosobruchus analis]